MRDIRIFSEQLQLLIWILGGNCLISQTVCRLHFSSVGWWSRRHESFVETRVFCVNRICFGRFGRFWALSFTTALPGFGKYSRLSSIWSELAEQNSLSVSRNILTNSKLLKLIWTRSFSYNMILKFSICG